MAGPRHARKLRAAASGGARPDFAFGGALVIDLSGRVVVVTGGNSGIGLGIARAFAAAGMTVTLNGFGDKTEIERTRADLEKTFGVKIAYSAADMTKPDGIAGMVMEAARAFGKVDVLVNNAGIQHV